MTSLENPFKQPPKRRLFGSKPRTSDDFDLKKQNEDLENQMFDVQGYKLNFASFKLITALKEALYTQIFEKKKESEATKKRGMEGFVNIILTLANIDEKGGIHRIFLDGPQVGESTIESLIPYANMEDLELRTVNTSFTSAEGRSLVELLKRSSINTLNIRDGFRFGPDVQSILGEALPQTSLTSLILYNMRIGNFHELSNLLEKISESQIERLQLSKCYLNGFDIARIFELLKGSRVKYLDVSRNDIGSASVEEIIDSIKKTKLEYINLSNCFDFKNDIIKFLKGIKGSSVKKLKLSESFLDVIEVVELIQLSTELGLELEPMSGSSLKEKVE